MNKQSLMKMNNILKLIGSAALAVLVIHLSATIASAGVAVSIGQNFTGNSSSKSSTPDPCGAGPRGVYDPGVQRWFVAQGLGNCDLPPASGQRLRLAVSASANPTGVWSGVSFPDSPGSTNSFSLAVIGMDAQGVYLSCVVFPTNTSAIVPAATALWSLPKADLLAIPPVITNRTSFGLLDPAIYGYGLDPAICLDGTAGGDVLATGGTGVDQAPVGLETNTT